MENPFARLMMSSKGDEEKAALNKPINTLPPINPRKQSLLETPAQAGRLPSLVEMSENDDKSSRMKRSVYAPSAKEKGYSAMLGKQSAKQHAKLSDGKERKVKPDKFTLFETGETNKDRQMHHEVNKFVEELKQNLQDITSRLEKEDKNYLSREYSRRLSADMYSVIIEFNLALRAKKPIEEQLAIQHIRDKFKPFFEYKGFLLPMICSSKLTNGFDESEEFDWSKRLYFLHKIQVLQTEQVDPIHRILTREHNKRIFFKELQDEDSRSQLIGRLIKADSPKLSLLAVQYGLLTVDEAIQALTQMRGKLNPLLIYTKGFKRYTKQTGFGTSDMKQGAVNTMVIDDEEGDKIMTELNNFLNSNKRRDVERASDIIKYIMHCIVLINDTEIERLILQQPSDDDEESKREAIFAFDHQPLFKEIKSTLFTSLVADNFESLIGLKEDKTMGMINQVVDSMLGDCNDMYGKCLKVFVSRRSGNLTASLAVNDDPQITRSIDRIQTLILEIVEGRRDRDKFSESKELRIQVQDVLTTIRQMLDGHLGQHPNAGFDAARSLCLNNAIHLLLNLSVIFTVSERRDKDLSYGNIRSCLHIIASIFRQYPTAKALLLGGKEWYYFKRLFQFYPCECVKLLADAIEDHQAFILNCDHKAGNLIDFLVTQLKNELPKYREYSTRVMAANPAASSLLISVAKSKITEMDETGLSVVLILRCLMTLFDHGTDRLITRRHAATVQRQMLQLLADFVWPVVAEESVTESVHSIDSLQIWLKSSDDIDQLIAELPNKQTKDLMPKCLMFEIAYAIVSTLNHTCLFAKIFTLDDLDSTAGLDAGVKPAEGLTLKAFSHLASFRHGLLMLAEVSKLLSHVMVMEYSVVRQDYARNDMIKDFDHLKVDMARFKADLECLLAGMELYTKTHDVKQEDTVLNIYVVRGILEPVYKMASGVTKLSLLFESDSKTDDRLASVAEIMALFDLESRSPSNPFQMFSQYIIIDDIHQTFSAVKNLLPQTSSQANISKAQIRRQMGPKKKTLLADKPLHDREKKAKTIAGRLADVKDSCLIALSNLSIDPIKKEYMDYHFDLPESLQEEPTTRLVNMPEDGCLNLIQFREKISKCSNLSRNAGQALVNTTTDSFDLQEVIKLETSKTLKVGKIGQHDREAEWARKLEKACSHYLTNKRLRSSSESSHSGFKNIDEGIDERPDAYYLMLLYMIAQELSKVKDLYYSQMKLENAKNRKFWFAPLDVLLASRPCLLQLLKIFDNLLMIQGSKIRRLFYDTFFEMSSDDTKTENDENYIRPLNDLSISPFKILKQMGLKSVEILIHSVISLQRKITRSVFEVDYVADCQIYFLLCFNIKSMVEENFIEMKRIFQRLKIDVDNKHFKKHQKSKTLNEPANKIRTRNRTSAFSLILKGVVIPKTESRDVNLRSVKHSDRSELVWYNAVTLMLLSELAFGLEESIDDLSTSKLNSLLLLFNNVNIDVFSPRFDMLEEAARLLSFLFERSQHFVDKLLNLKRPDKINPDQMYLQIVTMIKLLVISFIVLEDNPKLKSKTDVFFESIRTGMEPEIEKTISNTDILVDYYKKYQKFANHPIIKISRLLNKIMNTLAASSSNRRFASYMEQLRTESELMEAESYGKTQKIVSMAASTIIRGFTRAKKIKNSRKSERKFQGIVLYNFLHKISATVEIAIQDKKSMTLEFAIIPEAFFISHISKREFINSVAIGDHNAKLVNMMDAVEAFSKEGKMNYRLSQSWPIVYILARSESFQLMTQIIWLIAAAMNAIALVKVDFKSEMDLSEWYWMTLFVGNLTIVGLSFLTGILFIVTRSDREASMKFLRQKISQIKQERFFNKTIASGKLVVNAFESFILNQQIVFSCLLYILFSSLSLAGIWYFMPFQLLLFAQVSETASNIVQAIRLHTDQLIRTFFILLLLIYTYSLIIGLYFRDDFESADEVVMCETVWSCFIYCTDLGLRAGGGIGDLMTLASYKASNFFPKFFLIMSHFSFINTIALNIFAGIIIDTFSELRKRLEARSSPVLYSF